MGSYIEMMLLPFQVTPVSTSHRLQYRHVVGSIPVVGLSSSTMGGLPTRASMAVLSSRLFPPRQFTVSYK